MILLSTIVAQGQIKIGGNVYGGGNHAEVKGSTKVTVRQGDLQKVFGGARMANVGGNSYVNIDGKNAEGYMVINHVYGGNDITGKIGTADAVSESLPAELTGNEDGVTNKWNSYVHLSSKKTLGGTIDPTNEKTFIGQLFAGGNGDYDYVPNGASYTEGEGKDAMTMQKYDVFLLPRTDEDSPIATITVEKDSFKPELDKTYLDVQGGTIAYAYGGGNNATVKEKAVIHVDNPSLPVNHIFVNEDTKIEDKSVTAEAFNSENPPTGIVDMLNGDRIRFGMGVNTSQERIESEEFQVGRFFGGNNKADMAIRPTWNLQDGKIRNLYSGGNRGRMTSPEGILLEIKESSTLMADNVYGGCRMADVHPIDAEGKTKAVNNLPGYFFPNGLSARTLIRGGDVKNVYGGNDVTGRVFGGNAIGVYTSIRGDIYGGGNGSYAYTDQWDLRNHEYYGDLYYGYRYKDTSSSLTVDSLNAYRPNAEQVSIRIAGKVDAGKPKYTIIGGSIYCGGNSATLTSEKKKPIVELKIGSYAIAENVYLGNNGANIVSEDVLRHYKYNVNDQGDVVTTNNGTKFSSLNLTDPDIFSKYMDAVNMNLQPDVVFDSIANGDPANYQDYTSYVGSFFCGGNVGSMTIADKNIYKVARGLNIFQKFVGGCNNANVPIIYDSETNAPLNAAYEGGVLGDKEKDSEYLAPNGLYTEDGTETANIKDRLEIDLENLTITPLRWKDDKKSELIWNTNQLKYVLITAGTRLNTDDIYYTYDSSTKKYEKHTAPGGGLIADGETQYVKSDTFEEVPNIQWYERDGEGKVVTKSDYDPDDYEDVRLLGGNIYGGCYNSGHVNGNVIFNINDDMLKKNQVFDTGVGPFNNPGSGVQFESQRDDVNAIALSLFGAGYGKETEIWGSTTVNLNKGYILQVFGGGEKGVVGKKNAEGEYVFDSRYSSTVNLNSQAYVYSSNEVVKNLAETEYIYGGGNEGDVCGNTYVNLGNGRIYDAFGGASDADILGHTEVYIGRQPNGSGGYKDGFPWIRDIVYGGNDFGGTIHGEYETGYEFRSRIRDWAHDKDKIHLSATEIANNKDVDAEVPDVLRSSTYVEYLQGRVDTIFGGGYGYYNYKNTALYGDAAMPVQESSFVNIRPNAHDKNAIIGIFGGGTGYTGNRQSDKAQDRSYVLIDIPYSTSNFNTTEVFGSGSYNGLGMGFTVADTFEDAFDPDQLSAIIDLWRGQIGNVYGGSYNEGVTARTVVNVPAGSTITMFTTEPDYDDAPKNQIKHEKQYGNIFGGAYGTHILPPCDVFESNVNYRSSLATVKGAIFGGNNNERRTVYSNVNIYSPVYSDQVTRYTAPVFGAGQGKDTWSEYTEVNLHRGAEVYEVYGGGMMGHVLNAESVQKYMQLYKDGPSDEISTKDSYWKDASKWTLTNGKRIPNTDELKARWAEDWADAWTLGDYYTPNVDENNDGIPERYDYTTYVGNTATNLTNTALVRAAEMDDRDYTRYTPEEITKKKYKYNTNVKIYEGAKVSGYAYGGGYGKSSVALSGDVYGTTYIALLGGTVAKDMYAAGTSGAIYDLFGTGAYDPENNPNGFTASANVYVKGGSVRNVYGGGWEGGVGYHAGDITTDPTDDIPGETHVVIGDIGGSSFTNGVPTVLRNAYGGGEGGAVFGSTRTTINNGYIGFVHLNANQKQNDMGLIIDAPGEGIADHYEEKIIDETYMDQTTGEFIPNHNLDAAGCVFGGGYVDNSSVDKTKVLIYGGNIRNSVFGGGEIAAVGRGATEQITSGEDIVRTLSALYRPGKTHIEMYGGHVYRNVFGGGRGYDNLGRYGKLHADGCVFGQTEVHIHGGEVGSATRLDYGDGNVFGGGDIGYVYSAYEDENGNFARGVKPEGSERYKDVYNGYYYKHKWAGDTSTGENIDSEGFYTEVNEEGERERMLTEDCKVLVQPYCMANANLSFTGIKYAQGQKISDVDLDYLKANSSDYETELAAIDVNGIVKAVDGITFDRSYPTNSFVPAAALNTLRNKSADGRWDNLDSYGIIIHNAVFAGGNTPSGKSATNANVASVYGNATASINDIYHRDLITLGTRHQGGLYGDGNLTLVDGYRELNITNYGTDYYSIDKEISITAYENLPTREADYYELKFTCMEDCQDREKTLYRKTSTEGGVTTKASTITYDDLLTLFLTEKKDDQGNIIYVEGTETPEMESVTYSYPNEGDIPVLTYDEKEHKWKPTVHSDDTPYFWEESGVLPIYAGRLMNSIQRADFCGVWGSRMVMQGARDRVPDEVDLTNYTINRVREVSLNKKESLIEDDYDKYPEGHPKAGQYKDPDAPLHGNYFGIYNIVNYLGALTSDVDFGGENDNLGDIRITDNENTDTYGPDLDPAETTISILTSLTDTEKEEVRAKAGEILGSTVSGNSFSAPDVKTLYKLRSITGLEFTDTRLTNQTYYDWKALHHDERKRNNGNSHNKVALASGVYLEITTEESTGSDLYEKVWGPITGVIELDLINVTTGIGGGFVYAKNIHGIRSKTTHKNTTLTALNKGAVTQWDYEYNDPAPGTPEANQKEWETSGNFVHSTQTIIDDCYNISNRYYGTSRVPAHYWYIKGSIYVYDQYISAYTGSPNAFSEAVDIPLTITAASHGSMKLLNVQPNRYAYYSQPGVKLENDGKIVINDKTYTLNDPISYWDYYMLTPSQRALFVENTYVNCVAVNIDNATEGGEPKVYPAGTYIMKDTEYNSFKKTSHTYKNADGEVLLDADKNTATTDYVFRPSNNLGHDTGFILTYQVNNPGQWDTWYTPKIPGQITNGEDDTDEKITNKAYKELPASTVSSSKGQDYYYDGPTYQINTSKLNENANGVVLGQSDYKVGDLIAKNIEDSYKAIASNNLPENQATFQQAYMITQEVTIKDGTEDRHLNPGATISEGQKTANSTVLNASNCDEAYICTKTIQISKTDLIYRDTKMSKSKMKTDYITPLYKQIKDVSTALSGLTDTELDALKTVDDFNTLLSGLSDTDKNTAKSKLKPLLALKNEYADYLVPAYYCTAEGKYGGNFYESGKNYRGLEAWSSMSKADRDMFNYNYDALDLLIDKEYGGVEGQKYQYDGYGFDSRTDAKTNNATYSLETALDYTATYIGAESLTYTTDDNTQKTVTGETKPELTRTEYERLPNEQRHYVAIHVQNGHQVKTNDVVTSYDVYVVNHSFQIGNTPYAVGATIDKDTYDGMSEDSQKHVTILTFPASEVEKTYYYCRESYEVGYNGNGTNVTNLEGLKDGDNNLISGITGTHGYDADGKKVDIKSETYTNNEEVPIGLVITKGQYETLTERNKQKNFSFHGISPTETSTLYVSNESDIYDLSKDKIITVIYEYNYEESDAGGNVTPVSERHVLNIHIKFESGVPVVEDITKPGIILPGDYIDIGEPHVIPGAYEVMGGGWELFETQRDADSHVNGVDYNPTFDQLYWYQHNWYVAYYAKSYLGRTYSNAVPVSVANYHDLADVMSEGNKTHHMYIDNENVIRPPKIYIKDYTTDDPETTQNGLDLLKDLYDLSLVTKTYDNETGIPVPVPSGKLQGHIPMESRVKGGANLEFFLRTDIDHTPYTIPNPDYDPDDPEETDPMTITKNQWTPIGTEDQCFEGILHGDGHTISGLDHSLFGDLCGDVYNLGVTGSFNTAGVADTDTKKKGYVESCWVKTTGATALTTKPYPVFGAPSRTSGYQVVNSYYSESNKDLYNTDSNDRGTTTQMADATFYNGEVAYDLNNFYLHKRYVNKNGTVDNTNWQDRYFTVGDDNTLTLQPYKSYPNRPELCSAGYTYTESDKTYSFKYVEDRYANEDFLYAGGTIPTSQDIRYYTETVQEGGKDVERTGYYPIYPDDYLFFGQKLTYGWAAEDHQDVPTAVVKDNTGRLSQTSNANRVYRAPAYYRSSTMNVAHFNPDAYLAQKSKDGTKEAHPNMTAIDFAGHNNTNEVTGTYELGWHNNGTTDHDIFYLPLLDDDGLQSIRNCDETQNLVVYAPAATAANTSEYANKLTHDVLNEYFVEPAYADYYHNTGIYEGYRLVAEAPTASIRGHLVQSNKIATNDHLLVDKQDFNAPISYTFDATKLMWYQRTPDDNEYVDRTKGWQGISIPFTAELVSTHQKGEITHFYSGSENSKNGTETKIGHEYWLREFTDVNEDTKTVNGSPVTVAVAGMTYPSAAGANKEYANTFLWDYYYKNSSGHNHKDKNDDTYQTYYETAHTHRNYPRLTAATPYILGLPGQTYYEFDLSGYFEAETTAKPNPVKLLKQVISFVSQPGITIGVSDEEMGGKKITKYGKDYIFTPNYMAKELEAGAYLLNTAGNSYDKTDTEVAPVPFRPYFVAKTHTDASRTTRSITFSNNDNTEMPHEESDDYDKDHTGKISVTTSHLKIDVKSTLKETVNVRILSINGITVNAFALEPGQTVETLLNNEGFYIVQTTDGKFMKKLAVR